MTIYSFDKNTIQHDPLHEMLLRLCDVFSDDDSDGARILFGPEINIPLDVHHLTQLEAQHFPIYEIKDDILTLEI